MDLLFFQILITEFIAEMGDKTQLMLVAMTTKYKIRDIILGTAVAILVLNALAVLLGGLISVFIPTWLIRLAAAAVFLFFAASSLRGDNGEEEEEKESRASRVGAIAVFGTFFLAELGDKTQLTAITFGANVGLDAVLMVWMACSIGLFLADLLGMLIGYLLARKLSTAFLNLLAFFLFAIFGIMTLNEGLKLLPGLTASMVLPLTVIVAVVFLAISVVIFVRRLRRQRLPGPDQDGSAG